MAPQQPEPSELRPKDAQGSRAWRRWLLPILGGVASAVVIVIATPDVPLVLRFVLAILALVYVTLQTAAYFWYSDQS